MSAALPQGWHDLPLIRSYAKMGDDGELYRVEVRGVDHFKLQVTFKVAPKETKRGAHGYGKNSA